MGMFSGLQDLVICPFLTAFSGDTSRYGIAYGNHPWTIIELEQTVREEIETMVVDMTRRVMGNWLSRIQECTQKDGTNNGDLITEKPHNL
jgi:hypothetical protein